MGSNHSDVKQFLNQFDDVQVQRDAHFYFVKESFLNGEYLVNPKLIAANWLAGCFKSQREPCLLD
jgi:hypothetical protein